MPSERLLVQHEVRVRGGNVGEDRPPLEAEVAVGQPCDLVESRAPRGRLRVVARALGDAALEAALARPVDAQLEERVRYASPDELRCGDTDHPEIDRVARREVGTLRFVRRV